MRMRQLHCILVFLIVVDIYLFYNFRSVWWWTLKNEGASSVSPIYVNTEGPANKISKLWPFCTPEQRCSDGMCMNYLTGTSKDQYDKCIGQLRRQIGDGIPVKNNGCRFIPKTSHQSVALVSFPGSGNTWVRQLLEAASGICTGSIMCDMSLRFAGFTGENIHSGAVLAVKTHAYEPSWTGTTGNLDSGHSFSSAIILIRNPMDAMVSEWKRRAANDFNIRTIHLDAHKKQTKISNFRKRKSWARFIRYQSKKWRDIVQKWFIAGRNSGQNVLLVQYEDLKKDRDIQLTKMMDFLNVHCTRSSQRTLGQSFPAFHRTHFEADEAFNPYTTEQRDYILTVVRDTIRDLEDNHMQSEANLTQYLQSS